MGDSLVYILFSALQDALQRSLKMTVDSCRLRQNFHLYYRDQLGFSNFECIEFIYTYICTFYLKVQELGDGF